ncbi:MAG TPA: MraY family glycosyltransferase [Bacteroidales bacterium]|nr:undecaprenyl/decaprenyl-phosphate alpha-N-acetylglucosaminyl 1-phosphate transferase [Bacteroidales bacterium]HOU98842.1 MraY family glycosyltransferase [Bacteroidales bacterium]
MIFFLTIFSVLSIAVFILLHNFFYQKAKYFNIKKANQKAIRWSSQKKPVAGGITFFLSFLFATTFFLLSQPVKSQFVEAEYMFIALALIFMFFTGLADDMLAISPLLKLFIQSITACMLIYAGVYIHLFNYQWLNYLISILWYVGMMNSINMLDNMDAISSLVGITILSGFIFINVFFTHNLYELLLLLGLLFALITFMIFNFHPAKMYMGDNGSLFLGLFLGIFGVKYIWNHTFYELNDGIVYFHFLLILLYFLIPLTDTTTVTINRLLKKRSPFVGGKDHTTHALYFIGLSENKIAGLLFFLNLLGVIMATYFIYSDNSNSILLYISIFYCTFVVLFLYINAFRVNFKNKVQSNSIRK